MGENESMNGKNILFFNNVSVTQSQESQLFFLNFSNDTNSSEMIAIPYHHAERIAKEILKKLHYSEKAKKEVAKKTIQTAVESPKESPKKEEVKNENSKRVVLDANMPFTELQALYQKSSPEIRLQVVRVISKRNTNQSLAFLCKSCSDSDARVRRLSTDALGSFPCTDSVIVLRNKLKDIDDVVRLKAVEALGKIGGKSIVYLKDMLHDSNVSVRRLAVDILSHNSLEESMAMTFANMLEDQDYQIRLNGIQALQKIGGPILLATLTKASKDVDYRIREIALQIMGEVGNESMSPIILNIINNAEESVEVRVAAIETLGKIGDSSGLKQLLRIIKNEQEDFRIRAALASTLGKIGGIAEIPLLLSLLKSSDSLVRMNATIGLGRIQDAAPLNTLKYLLEHDSDANVRGAAAWAIGEIADRQSLPVLYNALKDKNANVRIAAIEALENMKYADAQDSLEQALDDSEEFVRVKIMKALSTLRNL